MKRTISGFTTGNKLSTTVCFEEISMSDFGMFKHPSYHFNQVRNHLYTTNKYASIYHYKLIFISVAFKELFIRRVPLQADTSALTFVASV